MCRPQRGRDPPETQQRQPSETGCPPVGRHEVVEAPGEPPRKGPRPPTCSPRGEEQTARGPSASNRQVLNQPRSRPIAHNPRPNDFWNRRSSRLALSLPSARHPAAGTQREFVRLDDVRHSLFAPTDSRRRSRRGRRANCRHEHALGRPRLAAGGSVSAPCRTPAPTDADPAPAIAASRPAEPATLHGPHPPER